MPLVGGVIVLINLIFLSIITIGVDKNLYNFSSFNEHVIFIVFLIIFFFIGFYDDKYNLNPNLKFILSIIFIYTYVNHMTRTQQLKNIESGFFDWLSTSKVSANKQAKIKAMSDASPKALPGIFGLVKTIMAVKDNIIDQLDSADADVKATTRGDKGGEGYVAQKNKIKLI